MGFSITDGSPGLLGTIFILILIGAGIIVAYVFFSAAREAHDEVIENREDDLEA